MSVTELPDGDHYVRVVPWTRVRKDADDNVLGVTAEAYRLRDSEDGLSGNWLEYAAPGKDQKTQLRATLKLIRTERTVGSKARLAISKVGTLKQLCSKRKNKVRVVHAPVGKNTAHAEIRRISRDDDELLELIATDGIVDHQCCKDYS